MKIKYCYRIDVIFISLAKNWAPESSLSIWSKETTICSTKLRVNLRTPARKCREVIPDHWEYGVRSQEGMDSKRKEGGIHSSIRHLLFSLPIRTAVKVFFNLHGNFPGCGNYVSWCKSYASKKLPRHVHNDYHYFWAVLQSRPDWSKLSANFSPTIKYPQGGPLHSCRTALPISNQSNLTPPRWPGLGAGESNLPYPINSTTCFPRCSIIE